MILIIGRLFKRGPHVRMQVGVVRDSNHDGQRPNTGPKFPHRHWEFRDAPPGVGAWGKIPKK